MSLKNIWRLRFFINRYSPSDKKKRYMNNKLDELEEKIEKMENCWNCKFFKEKKYQACIDYKKNNTKCCAFYKWELEE